MSDELSSRVEARQILAAISTVRRRRQWPLLQELERSDPDPAEYVLEELAAIHGTLLDTGAGPKAVRRLQRHLQSLVLVVLLAVRATPEAKEEQSR